MSKLRFFSLLLWVPSMVHVQAFSASPQPSFFDSITSIFKGDAMMAKSATDNRRNDLKKELLDLCQNDVVDRKNVEAIIDDLKEVRPFDGTANDPSLQKEWLLIWTTEKEINIFSDLNISGDITQTIDNGNLQNYIPFQKGGGLEVSGTVTPDDDMQERTNFEFISAELDLDWFKFSFPPIGKGWFDTVYLDDDLRVDENSRDDILICIPR